MRIKQALQRFTARVVAVVTSVLLVVGLSIAYWVGVALTRAVSEVFGRSGLARRRKVLPSYWQDAEGYGTELADCSDQS